MHGLGGVSTFPNRHLPAIHHVVTVASAGHLQVTMMGGQIPIMVRQILTSLAVGALFCATASLSQAQTAAPPAAAPKVGRQKGRRQAGRDSARRGSSAARQSAAPSRL